MNRLSQFTIYSAVLLACAAGGCGPRGDVAKRHVLDRIDGALGKIEVERAEIDAGVRAARQGADGVRKARIKAQVALEQIDDKARPFEERVAQCDQTAGRLRALLAADRPADIAGRTYSVAELKEMAVKLIQARKTADARVAGFKSARENLGRSVAGLTKRQEELEGRVAGFQEKLVTLDAEAAAAKAMKSAAAAMGDGDATLTAKLDELDGKIAGLTAEVRVQLQDEDTGRLLTKSEKDSADVDGFIRASQNPGDLMAELGKMSDGKK